MDFNSIRQKLDQICKAKGLADYKMAYSYGSSLTATAAGNELTDTGTSVASVLSFTAILNGRGGSAICSTYDDESLDNLVMDAMDNASSIESKSECLLFDGSERYAELEDVKYCEPSMSRLVQRTMELQTSMMSSDDRVQNGSQSAVASVSGTICLANSRGLCLSRSYGYDQYEMGSVVQDGDDIACGDEQNVCPLEEMKLTTCVDEAIAKLHAGRVGVKKFDVVLSSSCMRMMLGAFLSIFFGKNALLGLSLYKGKEGSAVASSMVTLVDDPFEPSSPVMIHFDADGVAAYSKNIIENGTLKTLLYSLSSAKEAGKQTTGNAGPYLGSSETSFFSLYLKPGADSLEDLFSKTEGDAVFVQEMKGLHAGANAATGDFSIECAGFEIKDGKKGNPVKAFTMSGNFYDLLKNVRGMSDELKWTTPSGFRRIGSPDVLVSGLNVAG
ncbi:MAG: metallopeptidase TldD-related protein [Sphaerochaetaceae bacterium]|jgi:PmbA protein|nr:metallopeptidase TldD-related protein [Sphaerochaetaceae bacterium]NLY07596.1 TldD/PmbA family protein [Spirochaetales bacterium]